MKKSKKAIRTLIETKSTIFIFLLLLMVSCIFTYLFLYTTEKDRSILQTINHFIFSLPGGIGVVLSVYGVGCSTAGGIKTLLFIIRNGSLDGSLTILKNVFDLSICSIFTPVGLVISYFYFF
ncbi:MAG: hypothetical protein KME48_18945 [Candidatus Thiodiazotropha sp. (ex Ctena orbiculata)]|nr:hypothetical protein [Candidatus Thiodiazotropha taylori]